ncbi:MAG: ribonuclease III [Oscillospiraceae bacterium]|nr:ribonuclease III [Oscillospiraceae bacterium]
MVREHISLCHDAPAGKLHSMCVEYVRAEAQQSALERIQDELTEEELDFVRRGRNANKVMASKNADPAAYRAATGVEAMFGYLYLSGQNERIRRLFERIFD